MPKLTIEDLRRGREEARSKIHLAERKFRGKVTVHLGTCGIAAGAKDVVSAFLNQKESRKSTDILISTSGCAGLCSREPMATVEILDSPAVKYGDLTADKAVRIFEEHALGGRVVEEYAIGIGDIPFFQKQMLLVLRNKGMIDPEKIWDYIARDGYAALEKILTQMKPDEVIEEVTKSGLRGRGGAGFPTGIKWRACREEPNPIKYLIGNCDEGDPGAYMDRNLLESDPHSLIEGMAIAAYAIGAKKGFLYIRTEYPLAIKCMQIALSQAREHSLLGENILGSSINFDIEIREGSGAFVCGEETSLIRSIEGESPEPRQRPPFPAQTGLWSCPTVINNVETLANVPVIINRGADWFSSIGTKTSKGTKIFSLVGKINNTGLIEVPMGITLQEIIYDIGEGIPGNKRFKAVQTGGPSGGCIPSSLIGLTIDYEGLKEVGSMMGSGGMIVMDEETCMLDIAKFFIQFTNDESCGKCTTCRDGSEALLEVLTRISKGEGQEGDIEFLEELSLAIKDASMCGLGMTLPNPVLSTIRHFKDEYVAHIREKRCPALVCRDLIQYYIQPQKCVGCLLCSKRCPVEAIKGELKQVHLIDQAKCTKCGTCLEVCPSKISAVTKVTPIPVGNARART